MAGYREHVSVSGLCGIGYGVSAVIAGGFTPVQGAIAGCLTYVGGMLPDLDSETGKPIQEVFGLVAAVLPMICIRHLVHWTGTVEGAILAAICLYVLVRHGGASLLSRFSVHRGMFHSIPALVIAAELVFLGYVSDSMSVRMLMGGGVALGFLSHLLLDELYSVQWTGVKIRLSKSAGSAFKMFGKSLGPNMFAWTLLCFLSWLTLLQAGLVEDPYQHLRVDDLEPAVKETTPLFPPARPVTEPRPFRQAAEPMPGRRE